MQKNRLQFESWADYKTTVNFKDDCVDFIIVFGPCSFVFGNTVINLGRIQYITDNIGFILDQTVDRSFES